MKQSIDHDAIHWATTLRDPQVSYEDIDRALNWINSTPRRMAAFERAEEFLAACDILRHDPDSLDRLSQQVPLSYESRFARGWAGRLAVAASVMLMFAGSLFWLLNTGPRSSVASATLYYSTGVGEVRTVALLDGSKVTLGGSSAVAVALEATARHITLTEGEALFDVAPDKSRPFVVAAGNGTITAVGTAFNVHRRYNGATVTVVHGIVDVASRRPKSPIRSRLTREMEVSYSGDGAMGPIRYVDLQASLGWRKGKLNFDNQPFGAVVGDLNRYSPDPIIIEGDKLPALAVSGTVNTDGILEWLRALGTVMDFEVVRYRNETIVRARPVSLQVAATHRPGRLLTRQPLAFSDERGLQIESGDQR